MTIIDPETRIETMEIECAALKKHCAHLVQLVAACATFVKDAPEGKAGRAALLVEIAKVVPR